MPGPKDELRQAYDHLSEMTHALCESCPAKGYACCSAELCDDAAEWAQENYGVTCKPTDNRELPMMGCEGCTVAAYMRPFCSTRVCAVAFRGDLDTQHEWNQRVKKVMRLERERMLHRD